MYPAQYRAKHPSRPWGILMVAKGGQVQLTGDLELGISTHLEAQVLEEGEIVLSAKLLLDMIRGCR